MKSEMKTNISVTIEEKLLQWIDKQVENARFRNRSHMVEYALVKFKESEEKIKEKEV